MTWLSLDVAYGYLDSIFESRMMVVQDVQNYYIWNQKFQSTTSFDLSAACPQLSRTTRTNFNLGCSKIFPDITTSKRVLYLSSSLPSVTNHVTYSALATAYSDSYDMFWWNSSVSPLITVKPYLGTIETFSFYISMRSR